MRHRRQNKVYVLLAAGLLILSLLVTSLARQFSNIRYKEPKKMPAQSLQLPATNVSQNDLIETIISQMSPAEKIGQLMMVNYFGNNLEQISILIDELGIGGIMLMGDNVQGKSFDTLQAFNQKLLNESSRIPLFLSVDQEGGDVARITKIIREYPYPSQVYNEKGSEGIKEQALYYSEKLKDLNINMNFSPVMDIVLNQDSIIAQRSFSQDGDINAQLGKMYVDVFRQYSLIAVPKHFPGYGTVSQDPHFEICRDNQNQVSTLAAPFYKVLDSPVIMSSHVIFSREDSLPATLSRRIMQTLREKSFTNILITDDIQMQSITALYEYKIASVKALEAGCDIVLSITKDQTQWLTQARALHNYLLAAYDNGTLSKATVDQALRRIIRIKLQYLNKERWTIIPVSEKMTMKNYSSLIRE